MAENWKAGESESIAADMTTTKWIHTGTGATITELNEQGLRYLYERMVVAADGVNVEPQAAVVCYGFAEAYADHLGLGRWLGLVSVALPLSSFNDNHFTPPLMPRLIWCAVLRYLICSA